MKKGKFNIVIGAQAGSESKGKLAAFLANKFNPDILAMAASPNAGHTAYVNGKKYVTYHLPVSYVACRDSKICLGPSSVINVPILMDEINALGISPTVLNIHPRAVVIKRSYLQKERRAGLLKIGSTNQGVGEARKEKLMRSNDITFAENVVDLKSYIADTVDIINVSLKREMTVLCEMTQGFDLDLEHGIDPHFCTSKMINPSMAMAEAGVPPSMIGDIYGVLRPYPIRVNNREGSSGPYAGSAEITWGEVAERCGYKGKETLEELTTTTKLLRRVFEFNTQRFLRFMDICRPTILCLQFANYINWGDYCKNKWEDLSRPTRSFVYKLEHLGEVRVVYIGTGPQHEHMVDRLVEITWGGGGGFRRKR